MSNNKCLLPFFTETVLSSRLHMRAKLDFCRTARRLPQLAASVQSQATEHEQSRPARSGLQAFAKESAVGFDQLQARLQ